MYVRRWSFGPVGLLVSVVAGCGIVEIERTVFPNQATDPDGNPLFFEDLQDITEDADLISLQMETELADLGIENPEFITVLIEQGLSGAQVPVTPDTGGDDGDTGDQDGDDDGDDGS